ncbi:MAG: hypothetical protein ACXAEU_17575 [Candidatus Hodarchaeales archaeon]
MNSGTFQIRNRTGKDDLNMEQLEESLEPLLCLLENLDVCEVCNISGSFSSVVSINEEANTKLLINVMERTIEITE